MEQERHLTEQEKPKTITRATARHLRRKRFKEARRAERQLGFINGDVNSSINKEAYGVPEKNKTEDVRLISSLVKPEKVSKLSPSSSTAQTENKAQEECNSNTVIKVNSVNIDATMDAQSSQTSTVESTAEQSVNQSPSVITQQNGECPDVKNEGKSKAEIRAERRAKQEAQRAAKQKKLLMKQQQQQSSTKQQQQQSSTKQQQSSTKQQQSSTKQQQQMLPKQSVKDNTRSDQIPSFKSSTDIKSECPTVKKSIKEDTHEVNLFKHLYYERERATFDIINSNIHPAIVQLGVQYANKTIIGSNARCVALLTAMKEVIKDFEKPEQADFTRGLEAVIQKSLAYLHHCRPLAVSMQNAMRHLKWQTMSSSLMSLDEKEAKKKLNSVIDTYITEQIHLADKAISITIQSKISNGNVILTYGYSSLILKILMEAHIAGKQFRVIVVDGRPWLEGKELLRRLVRHGIECSYILINALSFIMPEVSKVFLGAHAILANGAVMSRVGTAQVALIAKAFNVPVLVACETHKTSEQVQTDSIVHNELGNADDLAVNSPFDKSGKSLLTNWKKKKSLNLLNITYDVMPADLVTAVVTELAILPCTSVPVILRIKPSEI